MQSGVQDSDDEGLACLYAKPSKPVFSSDAVRLRQITEEVDFTYSYSDCRHPFVSTSRVAGLASAYDDAEKRAAIDAALMGIGMCVLPWYWMGWAVQDVVVRAGPLEDAQIESWERLWRECLAEFFYVNKLDVSTRCPKLRVEAGRCGASVIRYPKERSNSERRSGARRVVVPLGGGKDSIVVWEWLTRQRQPGGGNGDLELAWCHTTDGYGELESSWRMREIVHMTGAQVHKAEHNIVCAKWESCRTHTLTLTGHPWAALCGFDSALLCVVHGYQYVAVGNERSASYGNGIEYQGLHINHQYDKSLAFERHLHG